MDIGSIESPAPKEISWNTQRLSVGNLVQTLCVATMI